MEFKFVEIKSVQGQAIVNSFMHESLVKSISGHALFPIREKDLKNLKVDLNFEDLVHIQPEQHERRILFLRKLLAYGTADAVEYLDETTFLAEMAKENDFEV
jgi:predicted component of type VI protein secretion system